MTRPLVALVGRPNVGKSTLFNRLLGEARAIVEDVPGTTRDRIYADTEWAGVDLSLVDTGGLELAPETDMTQRVKGQVETALAGAEVIIMVVDVREGITAADLDIADRLRRSGKPILVAANKADNPEREAAAAQFYELGLGDPLPVSAYHGLGTGELLDRAVSVLPRPEAPQEEVPGLKIAIVGRPNVGKSMLLNAILGEERAIVSETPGTTRDATDTLGQYQGQSLVLIDTAGLRRRGRIERGIEKYSVLRALRAIARSDVVIVVLDATEGITAQDTHIAGYVYQAFKGLVVAVNKWDLASALRLAAPVVTDEVRSRLKFSRSAPIVFVSAKEQTGIEDLMSAALEVGHQRLQRLPTARLNQVVRQAVAAHAPSRAGGHPLKLYYATQAGVNPPTFVFFVNDARLLHFSYQRYLENKLRQAFGFAGTPLRLVFRSKEERQA